MGVPLILAGAGGLVAGLHSAASAARPFLERYLKKHQAEIESWALQNAFEAIGLPDLTENPTREDITEAINQKFLDGSGFKLTNIFDAQAIRDDGLRFAMKTAADQLGVEIDSPTVRGMRKALKSWVRSEVVAQLQAGAGSIVDGAADHAGVLALIQYHQTKPDAPGLLMTPDAIDNRRRQAKYRQTHSKMWVAR